jgi:predicted negative regulator of RcsB-dependent stress response
MTEQEQIEQLKNWIKQYGMTVLAGIVLALIMVTGWHFWQERENKILTHASGVYDEMLTLRAQNETTTAVVQAQKLLDHYPKTPYAIMAALMLARDAVINKDYPSAIKQLQWAADHSSNKSIKAIANIRIARIFIADKKPQQALSQLQIVKNKNFESLTNEVRGDALVAMNDAVKAKASYQLALQALPQDETTRRPILQMKLDNLASINDANS